MPIQTSSDFSRKKNINDVEQGFSPSSLERPSGLVNISRHWLVLMTRGLIVSIACFICTFERLLFSTIHNSTTGLQTDQRNQLVLYNTIFLLLRLRERVPLIIGLPLKVSSFTSNIKTNNIEKDCQNHFGYNECH